MSGDEGSGSQRNIKSHVITVIATLAIVAVVIAGLLWWQSGVGRVPRNSDGAIEGSVTRVWQDKMRVETSDGSVTIDTWAVCGDNTRQHISEGDTVQVYANRDLFSYDAWRILDEAGEPACPR